MGETKKYKKCAICGETLSDNEVEGMAAVGDENCRCWKEWIEAMKDPQYHHMKQLKRDRVVTNILKERIANRRRFNEA